jgi:hypothetical protein
MAVVGPPPAEPPADRRTLSDDEVSLVVSALDRWANKHPRPDDPVFGYAGTRFVSPRELVVEVRQRSEIGRQYIADVETLTARVPLSTYLATIERSRAPWWRVQLPRIASLFRPTK